MTTDIKRSKVLLDFYPLQRESITANIKASNKNVANIY